MKKTLEDYIDKIKDLPIKNKYTKEEILTEDFLVEREGNIEIYYAPHNDYINPSAKVFIVGITPGFQQMSTAISEVRKCIEEGTSIEESKYRAKVAGRFSGPLRKNIISMLDDIKLNEALGVNSTAELFESNDEILHTISLIPYPVFVKKSNYTGHTPKLTKSSFLMKYIYENFLDDYNKLGEVLIIPLGKAVEEAMDILIYEGKINVKNVLKDFHIHLVQM